ncbi:MAG: hypothetical protein ABI528_00800 [bacterium]
MKNFLKRLTYFLIFPVVLFLIILFLYIKRDVHRDFGIYENYSWKYNFQQLGDLSTKKLLNSKIKYNSYILGSSRTVDLYACYLQKKINGSQFFHYANWTETIGGIYSKLKLIETLGDSIENVIIYFDTDYTFARSGQPKYNDHYLLTNENKYKFYFVHFREFLMSMDLDKLRILAGIPLTGEIFPNWESDIITNDAKRPCTDDVLMNYGLKKIDSGNIGLIDTSGQKFIKKQISPLEEDLLIKLKELLDKHHTKYYIVITPLSDQLKFNSADMQILKNLFRENIYDFSGINKYTSNINNYPDKIHFAPYISKEIADSVILKYK